MRKPLFLGLLLFCAGVFAECPSLRGLADRDFDLSHVAGDLTHEELEPLRSLLDSFRRVYPAHWLPRPLRVWYSERSDSPHYVAGRLKTAYRIERFDGELLSPEPSEWVSAHELGHALFDGLMAKRIPLYRKNVERRTLFWDLQELAEANPSQLDTILPRVQQALAGQSEAESALFDRLLPYNELFADVIAVLHTGNPKAMSEVSANPQFRDFTREVPFDHWTEIDSYGAFTPLRGALWTRYLSRREIRKAPKDFVEALADAIAKEIERTDARPGYLREAGNVIEANVELLKALLRAFPRS